MLCEVQSTKSCLHDFFEVQAETVGSVLERSIICSSCLIQGESRRYQGNQCRHEEVRGRGPHDNCSARKSRPGTQQANNTIAIHPPCQFCKISLHYRNSEPIVPGFVDQTHFLGVGAKISFIFLSLLLFFFSLCFRSFSYSYFIPGS